MPRDYPYGSTKISDHCCLAVGLHKLLMDILDSIKQLCAIGVAVPSGVLHHFLVLCSFMLIVPGSVEVPAGKDGISQAVISSLFVSPPTQSVHI